MDSEVIYDFATFSALFLKFVEPTNKSQQQLTELDRKMLRPDENVLQYCLSVLRLCNTLDPRMALTVKLHHLLKGLPADLIEQLSRKKYNSTDEFIDEIKINYDARNLANLYRPYGASPVDPRPKSNQPTPMRGQNRPWKDERGQNRRDDVTCWTCNRRGHYASECQQGRDGRDDDPSARKSRSLNY